MSDPFRNLLGIGGAGCREVYVDPEKVSKEEFEAAACFTDVIFGAEGLAEMLGPTWNLVHDPRFLAIERTWAREEVGMLGGVRMKGVSIIDALDQKTKIKVIEDPELYSEMLAEGRHFRDCCLAQDIDPQTFGDSQELIWRLIGQECSNYQRRDGTWNDLAKTLAEMLRLGLVAMVDDYAEVAYSRDWIRMDTGEVCDKNEVFWDPNSGMQIPVVAVEVDTLHKALVMRAQVRATALRLMKSHPGIDWKEFESTRLTDAESDKLCVLLFGVDYDKLYTVMPEVLHLIRTAQTVDYDRREASQMRFHSATSKDVVAKLKSGEIEPIITPIEINPNAIVDPGAFLLRIGSNPYIKETFQALQLMAEKDGDAEAKDLATRAFQEGLKEEFWALVDDFLLKHERHPKQHVFDGRLLITEDEDVKFRAQIAEVTVAYIDAEEEDQTRPATPEEIELTLKVYAFTGCSDWPLILDVVTTHPGSPITELVDLLREARYKKECGTPNAPVTPTVTIHEGDLG